MLMPLILLLTASSTPAAPWRDFFNEARTERVPPDVRKFFVKAQGCAHFAGEEPYDAERAAELKRNTDQLCTGLDRDYPRLRKRHAKSPVAINLIEQGYCQVGPCISEGVSSEE